MLRENVICFFYLKMFIRMRKKNKTKTYNFAQIQQQFHWKSLWMYVWKLYTLHILHTHTLQWNNICTLNKVISGNLIWNKLKNGARFLSTKSNKTNSLYFQYMIWFGGSTQHSHCFFELFYAVYWKVVVV